MKIQILGYSGSGKSTFATFLAKLYGIEQTHLDKIYFLPNWLSRSEALVLHDIDEIISKDNWIIDGSYRRFNGLLRNELADMIFLFEYNRFRCFFHVIKRRIKYNKKVRPSASEGCI